MDRQDAIRERPRLYTREPLFQPSAERIAASRMHQTRVLTRAQLALEQLLDRLERGELGRPTADTLLVSGEPKADAVSRALGDARPEQLPAAGVHGARATRWLLDADAASRLPRG